MIQDFLSKQFLAFLVTGGIAALVNFGSRIVYNQWVEFSFAIVLSYLTGMVTAFVLAKFFVFKDSRQKLRDSVAFFILVNIVAILQTWLISMVLAFYVLPRLGIRQFNLEIAHAVGVVFPVFTSFLGHKRWSFR